MHSGWWLAVNILAVYRLSILVSKDKICAPLRGGVWWCGWEMVSLHGIVGRERPRRRPGWRGRAGRWLYELVTCPWCVSVWFAAGAVALTVALPDAWQYPALALAFSGATVLATRRVESDA